MMDSRIRKLAEGLVRYSCAVKPGEKVLVEMHGMQEALACALVEEIYACGALPQVRLRSERLQRALLQGAEDAAMRFWAEDDLQLMQQCDCYIGVRSSDNLHAQADVHSETLQRYSALYTQPVHMRERLRNTRWVVLRYPTAGMAQQAGMATEAFEDFYFDVCCMDYARMGQAMEALIAEMQRTQWVRIVGPGTDLRFSIANMPAIACAGKCNIPDGEVYTAPVKESVAGKITYNAPSLYQGRRHEGVCLEFEKGRIVRATGNEQAALESIFATDEGARYVGEFAMGVNPFIQRPMLDTLFDEKIAGSIHFTPGNAYDDCDNGNRSAIHWDLVLLQDAQHGGGEIYFDDRLIRKDGRFVLPTLQCLNPEALR